MIGYFLDIISKQKIWNFDENLKAGRFLDIWKYQKHYALVKGYAIPKNYWNFITRENI